MCHYEYYDKIKHSNDKPEWHDVEEVEVVNNIMSWYLRKVRHHNSCRECRADQCRATNSDSEAKATSSQDHGTWPCDRNLRPVH